MTKDKADRSQKKIELLFEEYKFLAEQINNNYSRMMQILAFAAAATFGFASILTGPSQAQDIAPDQTSAFQILAYFDTPIVAWFAPAPLLALMAIALALSFWWVSYVFQIRLVSKRIIKLVKEPPVYLYYHEESVVSRMLSMRSGHIQYRANFYLIIAMIALIYLFLLWYSFSQIIYPESHLAGFLYLIIYLSSTLFILSTFLGALTNLPATYDRAIKKAYKNKGEALPLREIIKTSVSPIQQLLPRSWDFFTKSILFIAGLLFVLWETGPSYNPAIWDLFVTQEQKDTPPYWTLIAFAFIWFILQEGFVQQAKYLWNDIRDRNKDKKDPYKTYRLVKDQKGNLAITVVHLIMRWGLGLVFAYFLDSRLFILVMVISLSQIIYELWLKPRGGKWPLLVLVLISLGSPLRVLGGALAIGGGFSNTRLIILFSIFFFYGLGYTASYWYVEAKYASRKNIEIRNINQSNYFKSNGKLLVRFGFISMAIGGLFLFIQSASCCKDNGIFNLLQISRLGTSGGSVDILFAVLEYFLFGLIIGIIGLLILWPISRLLIFLQDKGLFWIIYLGMTLAFGYYLIFVEFSQQLISSFTLVFLAVAAFSIYETLSYEQYRLVPLQNNFKYITRLWFIYFFSSDTRITFQFLLFATSVLTSEEDETAKKMFEAKNIDLDNFKKQLYETKDD